MRRVRMVMVPLVLVLVACFGFVRPAYADWNDGGAWNVDDADMGIKWGPTSVDGDRKGFVMVSDNRFNACLMICGISINDERLTADAKAKLSNSSTGGGFYLLAQRFGQYGDGNLPDWAKPSLDLGSITANAAIRTCAAMYGKDATWWGDYTELERTNALRDLLAVLNGGSSGGGSGGNLPPKGYYFKVPADVSNYAPLPSNIKYKWLLISVEMYNAELPHVNGRKPYIVCRQRNGVDTPSLFWFDSVTLLHDSKYQFEFVNEMWFRNNIAYESQYDGYLAVWRYNINALEPVTDNNLDTLLYPDSPVYYISQFDPSNTQVIYYDPDVPPTQWPDAPTYEPPTAPVVPDPTEPTVPSEPSVPTPVEPVQPEPSTPGQNPVYIEQPTYVDNTYTADLQGILDALDEHCKHLQDALYTNISGLYNNLATKLTNDLTNLKSFLHVEFGWLNNARHNDIVSTWDYLQDLFSWLGGLISDNFYSLNQHLTQLFNWLAEQFDFSFTGTGYNDDTVVSWLKKIYSKLGTGMNTRPNDPVAEPDSFGDWLTRLLQNFIGDLLNVGQEAVGGLVNDFQQLATKFPFCVPWDIAALLALFVAEPVAPVFDLPAYTITQNGLTQVSTYHISLADYNVAWEAVRFAEKIGFAVFLAWNTTHFREFLSGRGES